MKTHELIRQKRQELKISQEEISFALGMDQSRYSKIERGAENANPVLLSKIAEYLRIKLS